MITLDKNVSIPCLPIKYLIVIIIIIIIIIAQGSCLGPLLFTVYTSELFEIAGRHLLSVHSFADDTELYLAFSPNVQGDDASAVMVG